MARKPRRMKIRKETGLTNEQLETLVYGSCLLTRSKPPFRGKEDKKVAWLRSRDWLMAQIGQGVICEGFRDIEIPAGKRPWAWWAFESTRLRKIVAGSSSNCLPEHGYYFGVSRCYMDSEGIPIYETQFQYLKRNGLLLEGEEEAYRGAKTSEDLDGDKMRRTLTS